MPIFSLHSVSYINFMVARTQLRNWIGEDEVLKIIFSTSC